MSNRNITNIGDVWLDKNDIVYHGYYRRPNYYNNVYDCYVKFKDGSQVVVKTIYSEYGTWRGVIKDRKDEAIKFCEEIAKIRGEKND